MPILYVCEQCQDDNPEGCGHDRDELRIAPDGRWVCDNCWDEIRDEDQPDWVELSMPPEYVPR